MGKVPSLFVSPPAGADRGRQNGIVAMIQPRLPVIPSAARNLKSITTRMVSQCLFDIMTNSGKQRKNSPGRLYLRTDTLDSSTPLRYAQNDSDGVAFSSLESGSIVKCLPLSARQGGDWKVGESRSAQSPVFGSGDADHGVAGDEGGQLFFGHVVGVFGSFGEDHVSQLGEAVPYAHLN